MGIIPVFITRAGKAIYRLELSRPPRQQGCRRAQLGSRAEMPLGSEMEITVKGNLHAVKHAVSIC
jgi:hypothetical protein